MKALHSLKKRIEPFPRVRLAHLPTPLEPMDGLSRRLERFNLFIKRDDQTGLAFGGNKARKLEFIMADVLEQGADCVITWAGVQSNWCRQTAAAAARLGIKPVLILFKKPAFRTEYDGNLLLDYIFNATIEVIEAEADKKTMELADVAGIIEEAAGKERRLGNTPYIAPIGGSLVEGSMDKPWGAIGYVLAFIEIFEQLSSRGVQIGAVVHAAGSGATQAGLLVGAKILSPETRIVGINVSEDNETMTRYVRSIADRTFELLDLDMRTGEEDIVVFEDYLREGYGVFIQEVADAIALVAESEGVLLDPVYTGKAMMGLLDLLQKGYFKEGESIVFLHSGGTPALFPYREDIITHLDRTRAATE